MLTKKASQDFEFGALLIKEGIWQRKWWEEVGWETYLVADSRSGKDSPPSGMPGSGGEPHWEILYLAGA